MQIFMQIFLAVYFFYLGSLFASFYNVVGIRVLEHRSIITRSSCPRCNHTLRMIDVIPLIGFIIDRGKCHFCGSKIHIKYFFIEVFGGILFMLGYLWYGITWQYLLYLIFVSVLMMVSVAKYEYQKMFNLVIYIFLPIILLMEFLMQTYISGLLGAAGLTLFLLIVSIFDRSALKYLMFFIFMGLGIGGIGSIFFVVVILIFQATRKVFQKIRFPFIYIISTVSVLAMLYGEKIIRLIFDLII